MHAGPRRHEQLANAVRELRLWQRFHVRLTAVYGAVVFAALAAVGALFYERGVRAEFEALQNRLVSMAVAVAAGLPPEVVEALRSPEDAGSPAHRLLVARFEAIARDEPDVASIYVFRPSPRPDELVFAADWVRRGEPGHPGRVYDATQAPNILKAFSRPVAEDAVYTDEWGAVLSGYAPVRDAAGRAVALAGVDVPATKIDEMKRDVRRALVGVSLAAALVLALVALFVGRNVRQPLSRIIDATSAIAAGHLEVRAGLDRPDEFGILGRQFDHMAEGLQERERLRSTFGRYVSESVAKKILEEGTALAGEERVVTVLFIDIRSYSTIAESLRPVQVIGVLNSYLEAMGEVIDAHGGCVIEFLGDGVLAVFNAPEEQADHASRAVTCALAMRERLRALNDEWSATGLAHLWRSRGVASLGARIGVHTGPVVAGNMGSRTRLKYAIVGDTVNLAARVEGLNNALDTDLLVTQETMERCVPPPPGAVDKGEHVVKGRARPVRVWGFPAPAAAPPSESKSA